MWTWWLFLTSYRTAATCICRHAVLRKCEQPSCQFSARTFFSRSSFELILYIWKARVDISAGPVPPGSSAGLNVGQGSPLPSPLPATGHRPPAYYPVWSNQSWPAGDYLATVPSANKDSSVGPALTHSAGTLVPGLGFRPAQFCLCRVCLSSALWFWHHCCGDSTACENHAAVFPAELVCALTHSLDTFVVLMAYFFTRFTFTQPTDGCSGAAFQLCFVIIKVFA